MIELKTALAVCGVLLVSLGCNDATRVNALNDAMLNDIAIERDAAMDRRDQSIVNADQSMPDLSSPPDMSVLDATVETVWTPAGPADLVLNQELLGSDIWFDEIDVDPSSCAFVEGCVGGVGRRRIMRFAVATGNIGSQDLIVGDLSQLSEQAEYSPCHDHYHYTDYADYSLQQDGSEVRRGHKQAFCLMDTRPMNGVDREAIGERALYNCRFQGISAGWEDVYGSKLDCQWVDITGLPPGDYQLSVQINPLGVIKEHRHDNNDGEVTVEVPALDLTQPCAGRAQKGLKQSCGWSFNQRIECDAGALVRVGGGGCYDLGVCTGNHAMRACTVESGACSSGVSLAESDEGCAGNGCPYLEFQCPMTGVANIWTAQPDGDEHQLTVEVNQSSVRLGEPCRGDTPRGLDRLCGWDTNAEGFDCLPGRNYRVGCGDVRNACEKVSQCLGDPMLRVCDLPLSCTDYDAIAQDDDACATRCPMTTFQCPPIGKVYVSKGAYDVNEMFSCSVQLVLLSDH